MVIRNAEFEDMKQLGHIMAVSFRTAFADFVSQQTMDACAREENCVTMQEGIYREGKVRFLIGGNSGSLGRTGLYQYQGVRRHHRRAL